MHRSLDRKILEGLITIKLGRGTSQSITPVLMRCLDKTDEDLLANLVSEGLLKNDDPQYLQSLCGDFLELHGGDAGAALRSFAAHEDLVASLCDSLSDETQTLLSPVLWDYASREHMDTVPLDTQRRYDTLQEFARGGMGRILVVRDNVMGRNIALKKRCCRASSNDSANYSCTRPVSRVD